MDREFLLGQRLASPSINDIGGGTLQKVATWPAHYISDSNIAILLTGSTSKPTQNLHY